MDARPDWDHSSARRRRTRAIQDGPDDAAVWRGDSRGHGNRVWPVPGASQHQARSGHHHQEPGGAGRRRTGGKTIPDDARDRADRDVDGAARASRAVREEPDERQSSRPGSQNRSPGGLQRLAGADCLLDRTNACPVRAHRGRAGVHARCHRRGRDHRAAHRRRQLEQQYGRRGLSGRSRHQHQRVVQRRRTRLLAGRRYPARCRPRVHARRCIRSAEGRDGEPGVREEVRDGQQRPRTANRHRQWRQLETQHRDRRRRAGCEVQRRQTGRAASGTICRIGKRNVWATGSSTSGPRCHPSSCSRPFRR